MRMAILGTRGIPNRYGGFEQFARYLSEGLCQAGTEVMVYTPHHHPYREERLGKVQLIRCYDPEPAIGTAGQFVYDLNCILDSRKRDLDVLLLLGYTSSSIWAGWLPKRPVIISNMDGLEWKRSKYSRPVQRFLKSAEKWAVNASDRLVADSPGIRDYLTKTYGVAPVYIPYAAKVFAHPDPGVLKEYTVAQRQYDLVIARMEPENNIETIIRGTLNAQDKKPLLVVGNTGNRYGRKLKKQYHGEQVRFLEGIYDKITLNNLRHFSRYYFHGHSVGGTNPSLLEAMACRAVVVAHDNPFNKYVLGNAGLYFSTAEDIVTIVDHPRYDRKTMVEENIHKITDQYSEQKIISAYRKLMEDAVDQKQSNN